MIEDSNEQKWQKQISLFFIKDLTNISITSDVDLATIHHTLNQ